MMKKMFVAAALVMGSFVAVHAQEIAFETLEINYGKRQKGDNGVREFKFKNTGGAPLIIENAQGSCGCTVPDYPREPIMPGETKSVRVKYDTQRVGAFTKYVTVTTNSVSNPSVRLTITGDIMPETDARPNEEKTLFPKN